MLSVILTLFQICYMGILRLFQFKSKKVNPFPFLFTKALRTSFKYE